MRNGRRNFMMIAGAYLLLLLWLLFFYQRENIPARQVNLLPLESIRSWYAFAEKHQWQQGTGLYFWNNLVGNLLLLMPLGLLLKLYKPVISLSRLMAWALLFSFGVEGLQWLLQRGKADVDDLLLNCSGAVMGYYIAVLFRKVAA